MFYLVDYRFCDLDWVCGIIVNSHVSELYRSQYIGCRATNYHSYMAIGFFDTIFALKDYSLEQFCVVQHFDLEKVAAILLESRTLLKLLCRYDCKSKGRLLSGTLFGVTEFVCRELAWEWLERLSSSLSNLLVVSVVLYCWWWAFSFVLSLSAWVSLLSPWAFSFPEGNLVDCSDAGLPNAGLWGLNGTLLLLSSAVKIQISTIDRAFREVSLSDQKFTVKSTNYFCES